jgi:hypothetical protein
LGTGPRQHHHTNAVLIIIISAVHEQLKVQAAQIKQGIMAPQDAQCKDCMTTFESKKLLREHVANTRHMSSLYCVPCRRFFKNTKELERHKRYGLAHTAKEPSGQDALAVRVSIKAASAVPNAGYHQVTGTSKAQKPSKMMNLRQEAASSKIIRFIQICKWDDG